jgi:predicted neuraminidase
MPTAGFLKSIFFVAAVFALAIFLVIDDRPLSEWHLLRQSSDLSEKSSAATFFTQGFVTKNSPTPRVHAPTLAELSDGTILSVWYGGEREGAGDVALYSSRLTPATQSWTEPVKTLSRQRVSDDLGLHIRKLGNAVLLGEEKQGVWMFFVTASHFTTFPTAPTETHGRLWEVIISI